MIFGREDSKLEKIRQNSDDKDNFRKDFEKYIEQFGYELSTNLKKCQFLVNNDINSTSTKNKQAKEYGVKIITEAECYALLNNK